MNASCACAESSAARAESNTENHSLSEVALWNANFEQGVKIAKATDAKESWPGKGPVMPTAHLHGGAIIGQGFI